MDTSHGHRIQDTHTLRSDNETPSTDRLRAALQYIFHPPQLRVHTIVHLMLVDGRDIFHKNSFLWLF